MSHLPELNEDQRIFLGAADADAARLSTLLAPARTTGLTGHQWLTAAALAAGIADQVAWLAEAADTTAGREPWATSARLIRDTATRFELWAELAETTDELVNPS